MLNSYQFQFISSIQEIDRACWQQLINTDYPFIQYDFLLALEKSASVCTKTGWQPHHLIVKSDTQLIAAMPMYIKSHSYGEYVFDFQWANAYEQSGLSYYPKLLTAIPFTPSSGKRLYVCATIDENEFYQHIFPLMHEKIMALCQKQQLSSWHLLFCDKTESNYWQLQGGLQRIGMQYHWFNQNYSSFDDFLDQCRAKNRKNIKRERKQLTQQSLQVEVLQGAQVTLAHWQAFYEFYQVTYLKRSGHNGYLTDEFFKLLSASQSLQIVMIIAKELPDNNESLRDRKMSEYHQAVFPDFKEQLSDKNDNVNKQPQQIVAASLFFKDAECLYGRYWGCRKEYDFLHFELCYYQGIEYCIEHGLKRFDAGAQGEHKIPRGFKPIETYSNHWIQNSNFAGAIRQFTEEEALYVRQAIGQLKQKLPFKV
ncbi:GNAT family N-acetyltransferase [Aliikangiella maris]|uniref:GNAT family N-acetyltransferase n=2 Tax=Aliikangiella maris TaxID=3162458 RepID=A0ABV3MIS0_9GAMM